MLLTGSFSDRLDRIAEVARVYTLVGSNQAALRRLLSDNRGKPMSSSQVENNKAIIRRLIDAHNRQDAAGAAGFFAPAATNHGRVEGSSGMERVYRDLYVTFPDYHWEIQALFGEDDWVAVYVRQTGTHLGTP